MRGWAPSQWPLVMWGVCYLKKEEQAAGAAGADDACELHRAVQNSSPWPSVSLRPRGAGIFLPQSASPLETGSEVGKLCASISLRSCVFGQNFRAQIPAERISWLLLRGTL